MANGAYDNELNLAKDIALGALDAMAATPKGRVAVAVVSGVLALAKYAAAEIVSATTPEGEVNEAAAAANASISTVEGAVGLLEGKKISGATGFIDAILEIFKVVGDNDKGDAKVKGERQRKHRGPQADAGRP